MLVVGLCLGSMIGFLFGALLASAKGVDEEIGASVQFPDLGTVVVGDHDFALHGACKVPQAQVVSPAEFSLVHVLAVKVRRVSVDKGCGTVMVPSADFKVLVLDDDRCQPVLHLLDQPKQLADIEGAGSKGLAGTGIAQALGFEEDGCPSDIIVHLDPLTQKLQFLC